MPKPKKENLIEGWKIIQKYLAPHKQAVLVLSVLSIVSALTNAVVPYLAGKIIDSILYNQTAVFWFVGVWFLVRVVENIIEWQLELRNLKLSANLEANYLVNGFSRLIELPMQFHKSHKMGEVANRISRAADWLENLVRNVVVGLAPQFLSIIFALALTFWIKPLLASILVIGVIIYVLILIKIVPGFVGKSLKMHRAFSAAYGDTYDSVLNVQPVKQATAENYERKKLYRNFFLKAFGLWVEVRNLWRILNLWQKMLIALVQFTIFVVSIILIRAGDLTLGQLVMFNGYAAIFFGPFVVLGNNWMTVQEGIVAIERAEKILSQAPEKSSPSNATILENIKGEIEFKNVNFNYGQKQKNVLSNISFRVLAGEKIALVGESGVGKSSLIDLISYYYKPSSGKILVDGHNIKNLYLKFLRSQIAVVPQEIILFNDTVKNNIKYGSFGASDEEMTKAAEFAHADEFINNFPKKYEQIVGERGIKLSMGQKQRIALARAFLRNPKILILDEPTSALDAKSEKFIQESLKELMKGRTTFIIAHRLSTVREVDKIFVLDQGSIAESGTHDELISKKSGIYRKLYELQVGFS